MLCCGRDGCVTQCDVTVTVVALHGGVVVAVVAPHVVLWALHHVWCHRHCTACGVVGVMGVTLCGVTGITPHLVLQSWLLCHVVLWLWWLSLRHMGPR